ncbi:TolC family protein [Pseudomonas aeruginosa]|uniref:TolC family protein n=1 Tax=Pseudomonas aeruginosa TaxID=287 RepID=UPI00053D336F|nr:TolC family protein [Pseudomonas aeruginosa]AYZ84484.1 TolC family protein [Pseudomonas aeruginosa]EKS2409728.1 TolC family protein [Pseudomonas aeruginosa]EKW2501222.1 TolC family protein [Pseudomonas aeruginosa]EKX4042387.1 TolC family protein [Pseudomonas aeruginosa]ELQ8117301.1 TolC family protein [Pseudomonas aeruginosa]
MRGRRQYARKGRRHGKGAIWLLSLGLPMFASAMPLDQAVRAGLAIHPEVRSAMAEADRAGTEVEMAKGGYYPSVTMSGGPQEFDFGEIVYDLTASQMLYDWGRVTSKVDSASATQRKLSEAVLVARDDAALDIVETYLDVLASERRVEAVREHIQRLDGIREMTQARGGDGYADRSELDRANLELSRAQEQLSLEKGNLQDARNQYAILVGQEPADLVEPEPMSLQRYLAASALRREIGGHPESDSVVSLRFRMDTFQGLSNFRRPTAAQQRLESAKWSADAMQRDIRRQLQNLFDNGDTLRWREQSLTQQVTESEQVGELYREQFEVGRRDVIDLLNVQRERFEAERQLINLRIERKRIEYRAAAQVGLLGPLLENRLNHGS